MTRRALRKIVDLKATLFCDPDLGRPVFFDFGCRSLGVGLEEARMLVLYCKTPGPSAGPSSSTMETGDWDTLPWPSELPPDKLDDPGEPFSLVFVLEDVAFAGKAHSLLPLRQPRAKSVGCCNYGSVVPYACRLGGFRHTVSQNLSAWEMSNSFGIATHLNSPLSTSIASTSCPPVLNIFRTLGQFSSWSTRLLRSWNCVMRQVAVSAIIADTLHCNCRERLEFN